MKVPAPIGGLNYRDSDNRLDQRDAKLLDNWIPDNGYCVIREGGAGPGNGPDAPLGGGSGGSGSSGGGDGNGDDTPIDIGPPIYDECRPFSCSAFVARAQEAGYTALDFGFLQEESPTVPAELDAWDGNPSGVELQADKVGDALTTSSLNQYYLHPMAGEIDACDGWEYALALGENTSGLPQGAKLTAPAIGAFDGFSAAIIGGLSSTNNGRGLIIRNAEWSARSGAGVLETSNMNIGVNWDNANGFEASDFSGGYFFGSPSFDTVNHITCVAYFDNPRNQQLDGTPGWYRMIADYVLEVTVNGVTYTGTRTWVMTPYDGNGPWTWEGVEYGQIRMFAGMRAILFAMIMVQDDVDIEKLYTFYQQNFIDYEAPAFCNV